MYVDANKMDERKLVTPIEFMLKNLKHIYSLQLQTLSAERRR